MINYFLNLISAAELIRFPFTNKSLRVYSTIHAGNGNRALNIRDFYDKNPTHKTVVKCNCHDQPKEICGKVITSSYVSKTDSYFSLSNSDGTTDGAILSKIHKNDAIKYLEGLKLVFSVMDQKENTVFGEITIDKNVVFYDDDNWYFGFSAPDDTAVELFVEYCKCLFCFDLYFDICYLFVNILIKINPYQFNQHVIEFLND